MSERRSTVNASEMVVTLTDYDHRESPYAGPALRVRLVSDVLFVYVGTLTEGEGKEIGTERFGFDDGQSIGVDAEALYEALGSMLRRSDRHTLDRLREGTLPADHPGSVAITGPDGQYRSGIRRRA